MRRTLAILPLLLASAACTTMTEGGKAPLVAPLLTTPDALDTSTWAKPQQARVTHVALDLALDFASKRVGGTADLDLLVAPGVDEVVLDDKGLEITRITDAAGRDLKWTVGGGSGTADISMGGEKGQPLTIQLAGAKHVRIQYTAPADAEALQWLNPEQTAGKKYPYLFSQGQAILNRSWIPTQDSPGIRQTWEARITAPKPLDVVMSGVRQGEPEDLGDRRAFRFVMDKPVPPYLIALAAGDIDFAPIGSRTGVWAEPSVLPAARKETEDTERMVEAAESLYGPYRWGRYDMIVLPPSFPYGGMENPVMTFLTPTFIAGDKSLTGLVAHELAHSWSGNLVTNAVWGDSWLNEGVTSYFESRISEKIYGEKRAVQEAILSLASVDEVLADVGNAPGTALHQADGVESAGSEIIYDKGAAFLRTLEHAVGRERFDAWLRQWFDNHAFQPATSAMIYDDMVKNLARSPEEAQALQIREWIYGAGLPANVYRPDGAAFAAVDASAAAYSASRTIDAAGWQGWSSAERQRFLQKLPQELSASELAKLDSALNLSGTGNNEELFLWLRLAMANRYQPAVPRVEQFLSSVGRMKFVAPLFGTLWKEGDWGRTIARRIYAKTRPTYHSVTQAAADRAMKN